MAPIQKIGRVLGDVTRERATTARGNESGLSGRIELFSAATKNAKTEFTHSSLRVEQRVEKADFINPPKLTAGLPRVQLIFLIAGISQSFRALPST